MAFNHVSKCDCPVGDCFCGGDDPHEEDKKKVWALIHEMRPKDLLMLKHDGELLELPRTNWNESLMPENLFYVGQIDEELTPATALTLMFKLDLFIQHETKLSKSSRIDCLNDLGRQLTSGAANKDDIAKAINDEFYQKFQYSISDWKRVW